VKKSPAATTRVTKPEKEPLATTPPNTDWVGSPICFTAGTAPTTAVIAARIA
jgi:hypothetical protein